MIPTLRALHLFGVIIWVGNLLALTSLLRMGFQQANGSLKLGLITLARQALIAAAGVGAAVTIIFGAILVAAEPELLRKGWLHAKIALVLVLIVFHVRFYRRLKALSSNVVNSAESKEFASLHGLVSLIVLAILFLALVRPF